MSWEVLLEGCLLQTDLVIENCLEVIKGCHRIFSKSSLQILFNYFEEIDLKHRITANQV